MDTFDEPSNFMILVRCLSMLATCMILPLTMVEHFNACIILHPPLIIIFLVSIATFCFFAVSLALDLKFKPNRGVSEPLNVFGMPDDIIGLILCCGWYLVFRIALEADEVFNNPGEYHALAFLGLGNMMYTSMYSFVAAVHNIGYGHWLD